MRKTKLLAMVCAAVMLTACGNAESSLRSANSTSEKPESASSAVSTVSAESEDISYAAMIPDIPSSFPNGKLNVIDSDGGDGYCVQVTGCTDDEYQKYVKGCKSKGFSDDPNAIDNSDYGHVEGYSADGKYYVSLQFFKDKGELTVTCAKRRSAN